ncbi:hypothetical protein [Allobranchiibius sp. CTAmp26]|uniref:hypothetical protein n=1 Tax=Allobranchiibius sp. CTAmp26 TaxID=2815214 RepID=UPI001AA0D005|nr:hypothetical protein [Allobranchiibius sp. CTAmp26]MBO1756508.1 hypothetical protein [Allobranchiibius sp. CTAmp26]
MSFSPRYRPRLVLASAALLAAATGCSSSEKITAGGPGPALKVCGTTLWNGAAGAVSYQATPRMAPIMTLTAGEAIYLRVSTGCDHGAVVSISPHAATITRTAKAKDHLAAAVVIKPKEKHFTVIVRRQGQILSVQVALS